MPEILKQLGQARMRWFIPILSIFFIEEFTAWAIDDTKGQRHRIVILVFMYVVHLINIIVLGIMLYANKHGL